jgi:hypothetical protein
MLQPKPPRVPDYLNLRWAKYHPLWCLLDRKPMIGKDISSEAIMTHPTVTLSNGNGAEIQPCAVRSGESGVHSRQIEPVR